MNDLRLVHYYHADSTPLHSVTRLPREEARALAKSLHENHPCRAHKRFGAETFDWYWDRRIAAERQLYEEFLAIGGRPETRRPIYFALQGGERIDNLYQNFDQAKTIAIPLDAIDPLHVSFTYGDSVALYGHPDRQGPFMRDSLERLVETHGGLDALLKSLKPIYEYMEAQVWIDRLNIS